MNNDLQNELEDISVIYNRQVWKRTEYSSFEEYMGGIARFPLSREERREAAAFLYGAGLTTRAIASVFGISSSTVSRYTNGNDGPDRKTGLDGKSYSSRTGPRRRRTHPHH